MASLKKFAAGRLRIFQANTVRFRPGINPDRDSQGCRQPSPCGRLAAPFSRRNLPCLTESTSQLLPTILLLNLPYDRGKYSHGRTIRRDLNVFSACPYFFAAQKIETFTHLRTSDVVRKGNHPFARGLGTQLPRLEYGAQCHGMPFLDWCARYFFQVTPGYQCLWK